MTTITHARALQQMQGGKGRKKKERLAKEKGHKDSGEVSNEEHGRGCKRRSKENRRSRPSGMNRNQSKREGAYTRIGRGGGMKRKTFLEKKGESIYETENTAR